MYGGIVRIRYMNTMQQLPVSNVLAWFLRILGRGSISFRQLVLWHLCHQAPKKPGFFLSPFIRADLEKRGRIGCFLILEIDNPDLHMQRESPSYSPSSSSVALPLHSSQLSDVVSRWAGWALAHLEYGSSVNHIPTRGADYAHNIIACPFGFENITTSLQL